MGSFIPETIEDLTQFVLINKAKLQENMDRIQELESLVEAQKDKREWIRSSDVSSIYQVSKSYSYELLKQFKAQSDDWIQDGKILLIKKISFETWWKGRSRDER